jgi:hypothetical protein
MFGKIWVTILPLSSGIDVSEMEFYSTVIWLITCEDFIAKSVLIHLI